MRIPATTWEGAAEEVAAICNAEAARQQKGVVMQPEAVKLLIPTAQMLHALRDDKHPPNEKGCMCFHLDLFTAWLIRLGVPKGFIALATNNFYVAAELFFDKSDDDDSAASSADGPAATSPLN